MDIDKIFQAVGLPTQDRTVGDQEAMLTNCKRYIKEMCTNGGSWRSYAQLEEDKRLLIAAINGLGLVKPLPDGYCNVSLMLTKDCGHCIRINHVIDIVKG